MPIHSPFLKYFLEVAQCGSVRMAASRLFISSSAVNRQILKIEAELGTRLFDRTSTGMQLTSAGKLLLEHVERTLADADRTLSAIVDLDATGDKPITIAGQESVIGEFLSPVLLQFHVKCPQSCSAFKAAGGNELNQLLLNAEADIAVAFDSQIEADIEQISERELAVGAIVSPMHPLAGKSRVSLNECAEFPFILPDASWPLRRSLDRMIDEMALKPTILSTSNSVEFLRCMVDQQLGVGFQTSMGIEGKLRTGELSLVPLFDPEPIRQKLIVCVSRTVQRSAPFEQMLELLKERLTSYAHDWSVTQSTCYSFGSSR
jgi:DNA-binding transcriptional LysR family regulator